MIWRHKIQYENDLWIYGLMCLEKELVASCSGKTLKQVQAQIKKLEDIVALCKQPIVHSLPENNNLSFDTDKQKAAYKLMQFVLLLCKSAEVTGVEKDQLFKRILECQDFIYKYRKEKNTKDIFDTELKLLKQYFYQM